MAWEKTTTYTLRSDLFEALVTDTGEHVVARALRMIFAPAGVETHIFERVYPPAVEGAPHPAAVERQAPGSYCFVSHEDLEQRQLAMITRAVAEGDFRGYTEERMVHEVYWQLHVRDILGMGLLAKYLPAERAWADERLRELAELARPAARKPHSCSAPPVDPGAPYAAIDTCAEQPDGRFLALNGEYATHVAYCPFCGQAAPTPPNLVAR